MGTGCVNFWSMGTVGPVLMLMLPTIMTVQAPSHTQCARPLHAGIVKRRRRPATPTGAPRSSQLNTHTCEELDKACAMLRRGGTQGSCQQACHKRQKEHWCCTSARDAGMHSALLHVWHGCTVSALLGAATTLGYMRHQHTMHDCFTCALFICAVQMAVWHESCARMLAHGHAADMSQLRLGGCTCSMRARQTFTRVTHSPHRSAGGSHPTRHRLSDLAQHGPPQPQQGAGAQHGKVHFPLKALLQSDRRAGARAVGSRCARVGRRMRALAGALRPLLVRDKKAAASTAA